MPRNSNNNNTNNNKDEPNTKNTKNNKSVSREKEKKRVENDGDGDGDMEEDDIMDEVEYRKFLNKLFPSKHLEKSIASGEKLKKLLTKNTSEGDNDIDVIEGSGSNGDSDEQNNTNTPHATKKQKRQQTTKNEVIQKKKTQTSYDDDTEEEGQDNDNGENNESKKKTKDLHTKPKRTAKAGLGSGGGAGNYNIIFTIGGSEEYNEDQDEDEEYEDSDWDEDDEEGESENEDITVSSVSDSSDCSEEEDEDENNSEEEDEDEDEEEDEEEEEVIEPRITRSRAKATHANINLELEEKGNKHKKASSKTTKKSTAATSEEKPTDEKLDSGNALNSSSPLFISTGSEKQEHSHEVLNIMKKLCAENTGDKLLQESMKMGIDHYNSKLEKTHRQKERKNQKQKDKNSRIFKRLLRNKNKTNDYTFFSGLDQETQVRLIKEAREVNKISNIETPYRISLLQSKIPHLYKSIALKKLQSLAYMEPGSGEFYKVKNWVDTFMRLPFDTYRTLPVNISDGVDKCHDFMANAQATLDNAVYGLNDAKMQIMQMLGQLITNPQAVGTAIAIKGPMGTGKTTLVKEGISKILDRPFAFIALGGATDSSFLEGHSYTYEGSIWGKIVQILLDSKCMNPVIYFDELDKISDTPKGEEIAGILTHLTDTTQNSQFHDKYFSEIDFDLSKCLFIFSYNDESRVNPILRDRMYRIQTKGYDVKEKVVISNTHILPKIREQVKFNMEDIIIPEDTVRHIVTTFCDKEDGVRNLKRCFEIIYTKLNLYRLMKPGTNLFKDDMTLEVQFPFTVTVDITNKLIKQDTPGWKSINMMYL